MKITTAHEYLRQFNTVFSAIVLVPLLVFIFGALEVRSQGGNASWPPAVLIGAGVAVLVLSLAGVVLAVLHFRKHIFALQAVEPLATRLAQYYTLYIRVFLYMAVAATVPAVALLYFKHLLFAVIGAIPFLMLTSRRPNLLRLFKDLKLNDEQRTLIKNGGELE